VIVEGEAGHTHEKTATGTKVAETTAEMIEDVTIDGMIEIVEMIGAEMTGIKTEGQIETTTETVMVRHFVGFVFGVILLMIV